MNSRKSPSLSLAVLLLTTLVLSTSANAAGVRPDEIDCRSAQSLRFGMTSKQVTKLLGKPYSIEFSREAMVYGWGGNGRDRVTVVFDVAHRKVDARTATLIWGACGGAALDTDPTVDPRLRDIPKKLEFDETALHLAFVAENRATRTRFVEYIPKGQSLAHWRQMAAVFVHTDGSTPSMQLETARKIALQTGNPHFQQVYLSADGSEAVAALPSLRDGSTEYQVARWVAVPGGVRATVYLTRSYDGDGLARDAYIAREEARIETVVGLLKGLPSLVPPELRGNGALTITRDGTADGVVLVPDEYRSNAASSKP